MAELAVGAIRRVLRRILIGLAGIVSMTVLPHASRADDAAGQYEYTNSLIDSNDPYLLLHAHNPVDWHPWVLRRLRKQKRRTNPSSSRLGIALATGVTLPSGRFIRIRTSPN